MAPKYNKKTSKKSSRISKHPKTGKTTRRKAATFASKVLHRPLTNNIPSTEYDAVFEEKLAEQYKMFRNLKDHHMQTKKFIRILAILLVIILLALLLLSFSS